MKRLKLYVIKPALVLASVSVLSCTHNPEYAELSQEVDVGSFSTYKYTVSDSQYTPGLPHPFSVSFNKNDTGLVMKLTGPGWNPYPTHCEYPDLSYATGTVQVDVCADHWPDFFSWNMRGGGAYFQGDYYTNRVALALRKAYEVASNRVDIGAGIYTSGTSYSSIRFQSLSRLIQDGAAKSSFTHHWWKIGTTRLHNYGNHDPYVGTAWSGWNPISLDFYDAASKGHHKWAHYSIAGASNDNVLEFDDHMVRACEDYRLSCRQIWGNQGHAYPGNTGLPWNKEVEPGSARLRLWESNGMPGLVVAFTNFNGNHTWDTNGNMYPIGHYNLGLYWKRDNMVYNELAFSIPVCYNRYTGIDGVPDQPDVAIVDVHVRKRWLNQEYTFNSVQIPDGTCVYIGGDHD